MSERPKYDPDSGQWVGVGQLMRFLGIPEAEREKFKALRRRVGAEFEHKTGDRRPDPVYFWLPGWLAAWRDATARARPAAGAGDAPIDHANRLKKAQADKAELELARLRGELVSVDDAEALFADKADRFRRALDVLGVENPSAQRLVMDCLYGVNGNGNGHTEAAEEAAD